jgi:serine/threonine protein kinase
MDGRDIFTIGEIIGQGHIATVYRALDRRSQQPVALKVLREDSPVPSARAFFQNEMTLLARLEHPHIPAFLGHFENPLCIALQLIEGVDGETLLATLPEGDFLPPERVCRWGIALCETFMYLHSQNPPLVFRDLKPAHMLVNAEDQMWLVDFNLARIVQPGTRTPEAEQAGTEGFAAPEQYVGHDTPLVDIYALGATLHYLLTRIDPRKERPFTFAPTRSIHSGISTSLAAALMKALAYEPEDRFQNAEALRAALLACV